MQQNPAKTLLFIASVAAAACLTAWLYAPGLHGPFVFDDFANLPALGAQGPISDGPSLLRFLTSGNADPTGRPLAMASFLIEARDWPADPLPFKRDNLLLHLLNGGLLALLLLRLGGAIGIDGPNARFAASFGAAVWLLHPLFVSTVLYVVQREAMLPATFTLLALLAWLRGRASMERDGRLPIVAWAGVYLLTAMAVLCKANGLLVPLLIVCLEATLPPLINESVLARRRTWLIFGPAAALVLAALAWTAIVNLGKGPIPIRGWSIGQRLITEPYILIDYLGRLTLLAPPASSLFHDSYAAAAGLLSPWYVLPAMAACTAMILAAYLGRHRYRVAAAAILFFFAAHAMESTALPLELYFEHRNYLPAMLMFWPVGVFLYRLPSVTIRYVATASLLVVAAGMTHANVTLWADPLRQALVWASLQPDSPRAEAYAAQVQAQAGDPAKAIARADAASLRFPAEPQVAFVRADLHCLQGGLGKNALDGVLTALSTTPRDPGELLSRWLEKAVHTAIDGECEGMTLDSLDHIVDAAAANPAISQLPGRRQDLAHARGTIALGRGNADDALRLFNGALAEQPSAAVALNQAAILGAAGHASLGLRHLNYLDSLPHPPPPSPSVGMRWLHALVLDRQGYWRNEINHLRDELKRHEKGRT